MLTPITMVDPSRLHLPSSRSAPSWRSARLLGIVHRLLAAEIKGGPATMKKNIGQVSALYPVPVVVVGAMNGNEPPGRSWRTRRPQSRSADGEPRRAAFYQRQDQGSRGALDQRSGRELARPGRLLRQRERCPPEQGRGLLVDDGGQIVAEVSAIGRCRSRLGARELHLLGGQHLCRRVGAQREGGKPDFTKLVAVPEEGPLARGEQGLAARPVARGLLTRGRGARASATGWQ